jgi:hypothetical protein
MAPAAGAGRVRIASTVAGKPVSGSSDRHPISVPAKSTNIDMQITNNSSSDIVARTVQFSGTALGLTVFSYETSIKIPVAAGTSTDVNFTIDLSALNGQVTGVLPASMSLLDASRHHLATQKLTVKVSGSWHSTYGIFGLVLLLLTGVAVAEILIALARQRLSDNRLTRGVRFLLPGVGVGLVLVIGASILDVLSPSTVRSVLIVLIAALSMFVAGYFTPAPETGEDDDEDFDVAPVRSTFGPSGAPTAPSTDPGDSR